MNPKEELPEHQIFHILRNGAQEPIGPYSQNELVNLLNSEEITHSDYVYYEELDGWKPISQVFEFHQKISNLGNEGQDAHLVSESFEFITSRLEPEEEIYYIAVQELPALSLTAAVRLTSPKSVVLSSNRFCVFNPKMMGTTEMEEYPLEQIEKGIKRLKGDRDTGVFNIVLKNGEWIEIDRIPLAQLERMEDLAEVIVANFHIH